MVNIYFFVKIQDTVISTALIELINLSFILLIKLKKPFSRFSNVKKNDLNYRQQTV
jgi:hypothetical protein